MNRQFLVDLVVNRRIGVILLLGFSSGLPLALTSGTLQAWMAVENVELSTIGIFTLVGLPYTLKFLWAPIMDRYVPPLLGRRRGWILITQLGLMLGIAAMARTSPTEATWMMASMALFVAFISASQDVVFDAYRTDVLPARERGLGAAVSVGGYRVAMLISGAVALILADQIGWVDTYMLMAVLMAVGMVATLIGPEPKAEPRAPRSLAEAISGPLKEFFSRRGAIALLVMIVLYKLGDAFAGTLTTAFLIRGPGFTPTDVGLVNKGMGLAATLIGAFFGGVLLAQLGLYKSLLLFGGLQAITNLGFMLVAIAGKSYPFMIAAVGLENLAGGMGTAAFVALLMALCDHRYTATQFALLSALAVLGRVYLGPAAGYLVEHIAWSTFFFITFLAALPGLWLLYRMRITVEAMNNPMT
ncbi:MAG: MFS transporter [Gammaproteobacteria bacterium]|nr:MFS transporter [Gammaproteobacteria bacterium]